jgi:hypothetical protein
MNTLHDLRATLDQHAHDVHDDVSVARVAAVAGRARQARRRRAGAVVAAAAVVVAGVVTAPMLADPTPPHGQRWLAGHEAPATIESLGYTYRFVEGVESGDRPARLPLGVSDGPRLVTWASEADEVEVDANIDGYSTTSMATGFGDFVVVPPPESPRFTVRADGARSALAVYELDPDELPEGITEAGLTFRERVGSDRFVEAVVGERGDTDVSATITLPEGGLRVADHCEGVATNDGLWVNVEIGDGGSAASSGCDADEFDPGGVGGTTFEEGAFGEPGDTVRVRMWVSERVEGPVVPVPDARLAFGAYSVGPPAAVVAGWDMPQLYEHEGHLWSFVSAHTSEPGVGFLAWRNQDSRNALAVASFSGAGRARVSFRADGTGADRSTSTGNGSDVVGELLPGEGASIEVHGSAPTSTRLGYALYERVD